MMSKNAMNPKTLLSRSLLLIWTLTAFVSSEEPEIKVAATADGIKVTCPTGHKLHQGITEIESGKIVYRDNNTGEYSCKANDGNGEKRIFVKFRTCDNCVDLNPASVSGMVVGDIVATIVIGVAVYLVASQATRTDPVTSNKKRSDRQQLLPGETTNRSINEHYQPLRHKKGQKDTYDVLTNRK